MCGLCSNHGGRCDFDPVARLDGAPAGAPANGFTGGNPSGLKWGDPDMGTPGGTVSWSIAGAGIDITNFPDGKFNSFDFEDFFGFDVTDLVAEALAAWSEVADIEFVQVEDTGASSSFDPDGATIRLFLGDANPGIIGFGFFPGGPSQAGDILLARKPLVAEQSEDGSYDVLYNLVLHEIGHAIGLGHSSKSDAVMRATIHTDEKKVLTEDDIGGARQIYGVQDGADPVHALRETQEETRILTAPEALTVLGNRLSNRIEAGDGGQRIEGGEGRDTLDGGAGDDVLIGGGDADLLVGGDGRDVALFIRAYDLLAVRVGGDEITVFGADGDADRLRGVERAQFDNGLLLFDGQEEDTGFLFRLYAAAFGRDADDGLLFWLDRRGEGTAREVIAEGFVESDEFALRYGAAPSDEAYVEALYTNVHGRAPDDLGRAFWLSELDKGQSRAEVLIGFTDSPENIAATEDAVADGIFFADAPDEYLV